MKRMKALATLLATIAIALPAAAQNDETAKSFHLLPHLADGGGWQSILLVTNVSPSASRCTFNAYGVPLNRFRELSGGTASGSTSTFQLEGPGEYLIWPTKNESTAVASGYATLDCSSPVVAQVVFALYDRLVVTAAATVFSAQAATVFQFPVLQPAATLGFAIANDTNAEAYCRIVLEDIQRTNLGEATLSVPAKSNLSQLLNTAISIPRTFLVGSATVSCNQQVAMIGLHFELRPDGTIITFSTLPPAILSTSPVSITPPPPLPETNAQAVLSYLESAPYTDWPLFPGTSHFEQAMASHPDRPSGALITIYVNDTARDALTHSTGPLPHGSIIVKEDYTADRTLDVMTVMYKRDGYDPEHGDWYWLLQRATDGNVADGKLAGCQSCHSYAARDYVWTGTDHHDDDDHSHP